MGRNGKDILDANGVKEASGSQTIHNVASVLGDALFEAIRQAVREEIRAAMTKSHQQEDRLLDVQEAAQLLSVSTDWVYRQANRLPFAQKIGPKMLRFSYQGIQKYLATRKLP